MRIRDAAVAVGALALAGALGTSAAAQAGSGSGGGGHGDHGDNERIRVQDDCDQATFDAAIGAGTCVGDGDTTFDEFIAELIERGEAGKWRFNPEDTHIDDDEGLKVVNEGGEFHTFTEVEAFGPGCVPELNAILGLGAPPAVCLSPALPPGALFAGGDPLTLAASTLAPGTHLFQCLIHPWMQTTLEVRHDH